MSIQIKAEADKFCISEDHDLEFGIFKSYAQGSKKPLTIIHHIDADGISSAQIVMDSIRKLTNNSVTIKCIPYNYEKQYDFSFHTTRGCNVIVVDLSLKVEDLKNIMQFANSTFIIDHHLTTVREIIENSDFYTSLVYNNKLGLHVDISNAGVGLCYKIFSSLLPNINEEAVGYIDRYDRWAPIDHNDYLKTMYTTYFINNSNELFVDSDVIRTILYDKEFLQTVLTMGRKFFDTEMTINEYRFQTFHRDIDFVVNDRIYHICYMYGNGNSLSFTSHIDDYDFVSLIRKNKATNDFTVSFYTSKDNVDVSEIARTFNGGGHRKAAGCRVANNIYKENDR